MNSNRERVEFRARTLVTWAALGLVSWLALFAVARLIVG